MITTDFEVDDGQGAWCEYCLAMSDKALRKIDCQPEGHKISFDARSGSYLCSDCEPHPTKEA